MRGQIAVITACSLLLPPPLVSAIVQVPSSAPAKRAAPAKPAATAATKPAPAAEPDGGWPRTYITQSGATLVIHQPQVASWDDRSHAVVYAAVSYIVKGAPKAQLGTVRLESDSSVAVNERLVSFSKFRVTEANFPTLDRDETRIAVDEISNGIPVEERVISLDRVLAQIDKSQIIPKNILGVRAVPPAIFYSTRPAVLVNLDGDPVWSPIKDNDLKFAVNTNWDLFEHGPTRTYFLRHGDRWLQAANVAGPWTAAGVLPASFSKLPKDDNWSDTKVAVPGRKFAAGEAPMVFVSTSPAELILVSGAPNYLVVGATQLLWMSNTESDVFRLGKTGPVYYLVSGRWFRAPDFKGPWTFASQDLPGDFKSIPLEHPRSRVLAAVPGTTQAAEAVLLAQIPETARVNKKAVKGPDVTYQGEPEFQPVEQTTVSRAVNTDKDVIKVGDLYYLCFQGIWFVSTAAAGPWEVTGTVPKEIYEIPTSSPAHTVTYVTVVEDDDDEVEFATAAAFTGAMVAWGCVVWGTGYYYPPYIGYGGFYPAYYPYYPSYGYGASYNPWTGAYTRGAAAYGPYGGAGVASRYNPRTGTYSRGAAAYGPGGSRAVASAYNPRTGTSAATRQGSSVYGSWGQTGVQRGNQWASTSRVTNNRTGATTRRTDTSGGGTAITRNGPGAGNNAGVARTGSGDVYAGRDGNVYRKQGSDGWQKYDNGGWNSVPQPTDAQRTQAQDRAADRAGTGTDSTIGQLNRDSAARAEGAQRTRDASRYGSGSQSSGAGSYRPSGMRGGGGGMRGGGGRRR